MEKSHVLRALITVANFFNNNHIGIYCFQKSLSKYSQTNVSTEVVNAFSLC